MQDYSKLVKALRYCNGPSFLTCRECQYNNDMLSCAYKMLRDAADAIVALGLDNEDYEHENRRLHGEIEALQAEVERLKDSNEELRERQTYIDHYGDKWMTSAKDVPTAAYKHGYADGMAEERAKMQKRIEELEAKNKELHGRIEDKELQIDMLTADNTNYEIAIDELKAQLPKRGEWVRVEDEESYHYECSRCGERPLYSRYGDVVLSGVCPMCGAKMEVQ